MALGTELLEMTLSTGMFLTRAGSLEFLLSAKQLPCCQKPWCDWCQKESEFPHTLSQTQSGCVFWLISSRHIVSSTAGRVFGRGSNFFQPFPLLSSPSSLLVWTVLDSIGLYDCGGYWITLKKGGKNICSVCYQNSNIMSSFHSSIDHTAGFSASQCHNCCQF